MPGGANFDLEKKDVAFGVVGALAGGFIAYALTESGFRFVLNLAVGALAGAAVGFAAPILYRSLGTLYAWLAAKYHFLTSAGRRLEVDEVPVQILWLGQIKVKLNDEHRRAGWKIFVEATTRVITQPLDKGDGVLRGALDSMHSFFKLVREELGKMPAPPETTEEDEYTIESYAVRMLNDALRPCIARWHRRLTEWESTGLPESQWPLAALCRDDIEATRRNAIAYARGLGQILRIKELDGLLFSYAGGDADARMINAEGGWPKRELTQLSHLNEVEKGLFSGLSGKQREVGWAAFVELTSQLTPCPDVQDADILARRLAALNDLRSHVIDGLKSLQAPPGPSSGDENLQSVLAGIANGPLQAFLDKWYSCFVGSDGKPPGTADAGKVTACHGELKPLCSDLKDGALKLAELIGLRDASRYSPLLADGGAPAR